MSNANSFFVNIAVILGLVFIPLFSVWWMFIPLGFAVAFFLERTVVSIIAAFILDSFYFGGENHLPSLSLFIFGILIVRTVLRDRLRL